MARPTIINKELVETARVYLNENRDFTSSMLPTIEGLALHLNISRDTIYDWGTKTQIPEDATKEQIEHAELCKEFSYIVEEIKTAQAQKLIQNSLQGRYNANIAKLILSGKHGYVEKQEIDQNISGELKTGESNPELARQFADYLKNK